MLTFSWNLRYFKGGATIKDFESPRGGNMMQPGMMPGGHPPMMR